MGCTIEVKVLGILKLERKQCLVMDYIHSKGKNRAQKHFNWNLFYLQLYQELVGPTVVAGNP